MMRDGFKRLFGGSVPLANLLRGFQIETENHHNWLRKEYHIPVDQLPAKEDSYINVSQESMEQITHETVKSSSSAKYRVKLASYGFGTLRCIVNVRPDREFPHATIHVRGKETPYIILENSSGDYKDADGNVRNLREEGYLPQSERAARKYIQWQIALDSEKIISTLFKQALLDPPEMPERAQPLTRTWEPDPPGQKEAPPAGEAAPIVASGTKEDTSKSSQTTAAKHVSVLAQSGISITDSSTTLRPIATFEPNGPDCVQVAHKTTSTNAQKLHRERVDRDALAVAPLTPETYIDVLSLILPIPAKATMDAKEWHMFVEEPCQWMYDHREPGQAPRYVIEDLIRRAKFTQDDKVFWAGKHTLPSNLVGRDKIDGKPVGALNGNNWNRMPWDWKKAGGYHPVIDIEYYGPLPAPVIADADYRDGYTGQDTPESRQDEQETLPPAAIETLSQVKDAPSESHPERHTDEMPVVSVPPPRISAVLGQRFGNPLERSKSGRGMLRGIADGLVEEIRREYPMLNFSIEKLSDNPGSHRVLVEYAPDQFLDLRSRIGWKDRLLEVLPRMEVVPREMARG